MPKEDKLPTRYYSDLQENDICKKFNATKQPSSGSGKFLVITQRQVKRKQVNH